MATEPTRKVGQMDCCVCGKVMPVRLNGRDTLNLSCPWCDHSSYAKAGTEAHRIVTGWIRKDPEAEPQPSAGVVPAAVLPPPTAHKKAASTFFG